MTDEGEALGGLYLTLGEFTRLLWHHVERLSRRGDPHLTYMADYMRSIDESYLAEFQRLHHDELMTLASQIEHSELTRDNKALSRRVNFARATFLSVLDQHARVMQTGATLAAQCA
jgi:hypothetical protein